MHHFGSYSYPWRQYGGSLLHKDQLKEPHGYTSMGVALVTRLLDEWRNAMKKIRSKPSKMLFFIWALSHLAILRHSGILGRCTDLNYSPSLMCGSSSVLWTCHLRNSGSAMHFTSCKFREKFFELTDWNPDPIVMGGILACRVRALCGSWCPSLKLESTTYSIGDYGFGKRYYKYGWTAFLTTIVILLSRAFRTGTS